MNACRVCAATDQQVKLWRSYQSFDPDLLCVDHVGSETGFDVSGVREHGAYMTWERAHDLETGLMCEINEWHFDLGWYVPALPVAGQERSWWGWASDHPDGREAFGRWREMPLRLLHCWCGGEVGLRTPGDRRGLGCWEDLFHDWQDAP